MARLIFFITFSLITLFYTDLMSQSGQKLDSGKDSLVLKDGLIINLELQDRNKVISPNAVVSAIETNEWKTPSENAEFRYKNKVIGKWKNIHANVNGWFEDSTLVNSYVYFNYESDKEDIIFLEAMGDGMVYVNGSAHSGNPYRYQDRYEAWEVRFDYSFIPVKVKKGKNELLFACDRGILKVKIHPGKSGLILNEKDLTIPDIVLNEDVNTFGAIPIINATENTYKDLTIKTWVDNNQPEYYSVKQINPLSILKTPFSIKAPIQREKGKIKLNIELIEKNKSENQNNVLATAIIELNSVGKDEIHKETFISNMDGSVQYYAVNPPINVPSEIKKPALFLSLHGAGVEAINQAGAYGRKNWGYLVAPTNRRPYGYNWENWGRMDALEVLSIAKQKFNIDENRVYLTGHSMGGHGTWQLGIDYPDQFAAIGPSAGWISIWSYRIRGANDSSEMKSMLLRSSKNSDTYAFTNNLKQNGIYIIHGDADDNVPPQQAKSMIENLSKFHKDFIYYEQPGAGHWWDVSDEPGSDCVDWAPMFEFFSHHAVPGKDRVKMIDFTTANPAITSRNNWIEIINQIQQQKLSRINIHLESGNRKFVGTTENIQVMSIDPSMLSVDQPVTIVMDNQTIPNIKFQSNKKIFLEKVNNTWGIITEPIKQNKYPARTGNIREVLNNNVVFVYGTHGNQEENIWAFEKARYDAERIWYQGNGSIEVIKDNDFNPAKFKDRNVVLFGNSKTNSAWNSLLNDSPVQVDNKKITVGNKTFKGNDYSCLMIRPRKDSEIASVAIISGTGIKGLEMANFAQYHHPYLSLPDIVIYNSDIMDSDENGVKFAGYFGNDWSLEKGEFVPAQNTAGTIDQVKK